MSVFLKRGNPKLKKKYIYIYIYINVFQSFSKEIFFKNVFLHTKVCFQKCFLKKIHAFQKKKKSFQKYFYRVNFVKKNVFFLPLKRIKIYLLKKCFYDVGFS